MEVVVLENNSEILVENKNAEFIERSSTDNTIIREGTTEFISSSATETVLVEVPNNTVVVTGIMGPAGKDGG